MLKLLLYAIKLLCYRKLGDFSIMYEIAILKNGVGCICQMMEVFLHGKNG